MMKSIVVSVLFVACAVCAFASSPEEYRVKHYRHELNLSIGNIAVVSSWSNDYEKDVRNGLGRYDLDGTTVLLYKWDEEPAIYAANALKAASYYYHFNHYVAAGGLFGFCSVKDHWGTPQLYELAAGKTTRGFTDVRGTSLFIMPSVKWKCMNCRWCSLYMKLSCGAHYQRLHLDSDLIPAEQKEPYEKSHVGFAFHITPFGWEIGSGRIRWFCEFGVGMNSNVQTGLTYRFRRY